MIAKVNVELELVTLKKVYVELWDRDLLQDDLIESQIIENSGLVEFIFSTQKSGELNPELEIRVKDESGFEVYKSKVDHSLEAFKVNNITGFVENTTVTFEKIIL
jgi:hypothetical protein